MHVYFLLPATSHGLGYRRLAQDGGPKMANDGDGSLDGMAQLSREDGKSQSARMLTSLDAEVGE